MNNMKKALISLATLAFAGVVLASCSSNSLKTSKVNVSKPSQGKAVDEVTVEYGGESVVFKSSQDFSDVVDSIITLNNTDNIMYPEQYKENYTFEKSFKSTNEYNAGFVEGAFDSFSYNEKVHRTIDKSIQFVEGDLSTTSNINIYYDNYIYNKTSVDFNGYTYSRESAQEGIAAGNQTQTTTGKSVDGARYHYEEENNEDKKSTSSEKYRSKDEYYSYLSFSQNFDDDDYGDTFVATSENGRKSYSIDSYLDYNRYDTGDIEFFASACSDEYKDYFETVSFTLTEDKIILKAKANLSNEAYDYAYYKYSLNGGDFATILSDVMDNEFKGSYVEAEAWLSFEGASDRDYAFTLVYSTMEQVDKYNIENEITEKMLGELATDLKSYIGKTYTKVGTTNETTELAISNDDYDKKIDSFISKAKKNNAFDGLVFTSNKSLW